MPMITETTLLAEREITERLLDYGRGVDRLDAELLSSVWHVGATADYGEARLRGPVGAVTDELLREHRARTFHHHNLTEPLVRIEGERAVSESNVIVIRRWRPQGQWRWMDEQTCLRFLDRWSRRGGRWAIDHRLALTEIAWQQPVAQAAVGQLAQRDRTDPVYAHFAGFERVGVDGEQGLAMLRAERDIRRQLSTYSRGVDRFDPDVWKAAWHSDATFGYEGEIDGRAHDMAFVMTFGHYKWVAHSHMSMRPAIRVRDDTAVSETLNFAVLHGYRDTTGRSVQDHFRGRYLDRWEKRDGRWAIARRFNPRGGKWQQTVDSEVGTLMRRDRSDPSYALFASLARGSEEDDRALLTAEHAVRTQLQSGVRALDRLDADLYGSLWWPEGRLQDRERGVDGVARSHLRGLHRHAVRFENDAASMAYGYPVVQGAFALTHTHLGGLAGHRLVREHLDPHLPFTLHVTGERHTGGFDLTAGEPHAFHGLQAEGTQGYAVTALGHALHAALVHIAALAALRLQHGS